MAWRDLNRPAPPPPHPQPDPEGPHAHLCVLASGSSGNCSLLRVRSETGRPLRTVLIDAGLSPTRTRRLLSERGVPLAEVDDILLTHLDADHFHPGWARVRDCRATLRLHRRHLGKAQRRGLLLRRNEPFSGPFEMGSPLRVEPVLMSHDDLGVAAFRIETVHGDTLGYATDLGRTTDELTGHLAGVGLLAIESNYCPEMQAASDRPAFLKRRITGGAGHLSNQQCAHAVHAIDPAGPVVLLHLSRQCNTPELARRAHADAPYEPLLSSQNEPTPWIPLTSASHAARRAPSRARGEVQGLLFGHAG